MRAGIPDFLPRPGRPNATGVDTAELAATVDNYDAIHDASLFNVSVEMREAVSRVRPQDGQRLLDAGCGMGLLFDHVPAGCHSVALDVSHVALDKTRARHPHVRTVQGMGEALPFPEGSFDLVFSMGSLEHFISPEKGLEEFSRVLVPGGRAVLLLPKKAFLLRNAIHYYIYPNFHPVQFVRRALLRLRRFGGMHVQIRDRHFTRPELVAFLRASPLAVEEVLDVPGTVPSALAYVYLAVLRKAGG
ncbi:class I SAM-dependent methyltransferase [Fundidesulfovibrio magnetotacticus]|uniref:class I SAM-dependent methyltransferase n=1 Tax=Fundidesulfovibrio magnetotacticus TaxID=2730080 RepID=UPI0015663B03|nr:class I SAM-dependent methyltransferase [Fundidesulfovibrio magnetotacticus]